MEKKHWIFVGAVFIGFAALSTAIYVLGKRMHMSGEGLATDETKEYIVQVFAKSMGVQGVDFRAQAPAFRLRSGQSRDVFFVLRNLESKESVTATLQGTFHPPNPTIVDTSPLMHEIRLGPNEVRKLPFRISLSETPPETIDGTIDWRVELSPK